jgi:hypothetical protein
MNKEEENKLVSLLKKLKPGFLPYDIFVEMARIIALPIIEIVPFRIISGQVEVLLLSRGIKDEIWPNALHTPGTVILATDSEENNLGAFSRVFDDELKGTEATTPYYVGSRFNKSKRGAEQAQIYWVEIVGEPKAGVFYAVNDLPDSLISSQLGFISQAVDSYVKFKHLS